MKQTFVIECPVHACRDDVVSVFALAERSGTGFAALRTVLTPSAKPSPPLYNETTGAWFLTGSQLAMPATSAAPSPALPVTRVIRGTVCATTTVQDLAHSSIKTHLTIEVLEERPVAAGEDWMPRG